MRKLGLVQLFCCKVDDLAKLCLMVDYVREMNVKKSHVCMVNMDRLIICSSCQCLQ